MNSLETIKRWNNLSESYNKDNFEVWNGERTKLRMGAMGGPIGVAIARMIRNTKNYSKSHPRQKWFDDKNYYPENTSNKNMNQTEVYDYNPNEYLNSGPVLPERL